MRSTWWVVAVAVVVALVACKPDPGEEALKKATDLFKKSDFEACGPAFEEALKLDPKLDEKTWEKAAFCYKQAKNYDKTAEILLKQAEPKPVAERVTLLRNIANMFLTEAKELDQAEKYFLEAMKLDPKDEASLAWLAEISSYRGGARNPKESAKTDQLDIALARYDELIGLNPKAPIPYVNKRIVLIKYVNHLKLAKAQAEKDAEENKADKQVAADFLEKAKELQAKADEKTAVLEQTTATLAEVQKAAKEAKDAGK